MGGVNGDGHLCAAQRRPRAVGPGVGYVGLYYRRRLIDGQPSVYFAGDTDVFPAMADWAGTLDLALLPVWGWGPTLGAGHMDPERAAEACQLLAPRLAIPIHWGTLYPMAVQHVSPGFLINPPRLFAEFVRRLAPQVAVHILQPGEQYES